MTRKEIESKLRTVVKQIVVKYHPETIILFGSAARGELTADSDIDFLIIKKDVPDRGIDRLYEIDSLIERKGLALDFLVYKPEELNEGIGMGDPFIKEITTKGIVLYGRYKAGQ